MVNLINNLVYSTELNRRIRLVLVATSLISAVPLTAIELNSPVPSFSSQPDTAPIAAEEYTVLDFNGSQLQDKNWLSKQTPRKFYTFVSPKGDSGADKLSLAVGEGINGSNALAVEYTSHLDAQGNEVGSGLPGFWVLRGSPKGGNATNKEGYLLPSGRRANQIEFSLKFPKGFRQNSSGSPKIIYPNHMNFVMGTYNFDPALIGGGNPVKESNNWHFYHQIFLRHDKAGDDWIRVVLNEAPQHQRGESTRMPALNPTAEAGNYFEIMTRFYLDCEKYFGDPEIPAEQVRMLVDDIKFRYEPPKQKVSLAFHDIPSSSLQTIKTKVPNIVYFSIRNDGESEFSGKMAVARMGGIKAQIKTVSGDKIGEIQIPAKSLKTYQLELSATEPGKSFRAGVTLVSSDQFRSNATSNTRSLTSDYVEKRWFSQQGPHDAEAKGIFLRLKSVD